MRGRLFFTSFPFLASLVILISVIYPRFISLGFYPQMDDGFFVYWSRIIYENLASGHGLPDWGGLSLYALLYSWAFALPGLPILWLRGADMLVAACAAWLFCLVLYKESNQNKASLLIALVFLCGMNNFLVIDAGLKNPFFMAYVPLFGALYLSQWKNITPAIWLAIGALTALAVLIRETLVPFAIFGAIAIWIGYDWKTCCRYCAGGIACSILVIGLLAICRHGLGGLAHYYAILSSIYENENPRRSILFLQACQHASVHFKGIILFFLTSLTFMVLNYTSIYYKSIRPKRALFWVVATLIPLIEPITKIGFIYHLAVCLPGMAGLCAQILGQLQWPPKKYYAFIAAVLACYTLYNHLPRLDRLEVTLEVLKEFPQKKWPNKLAEKCNTLKAAQTVNDLAPQAKTIATNGHTFFLYDALHGMPPLDGKFAPNDIFHLSDIGRTYTFLDHNEEKTIQAIRDNPPDVIIAGYTYDSHEATYPEIVPSIIDKTGIYEHLATIPQDRSKNYGWMGYRIYRKIKSNF